MLLIDQALLELGDLLGAPIILHPVVIDQFVQACVRVCLLLVRAVHHLIITMPTKVPIRSQTKAPLVILIHHHHGVTS